MANTPFDTSPDQGTSQQANDIGNQWSQWLDNPQNRTFLLQAGATLLQTPGFGETPAGQIGRAISEGGAAVSRGQELESKQELRQAQADTAAARAGEATTRLGLAQLTQQNREQALHSSQLRDAQRAYDADFRNMEMAYKTRMAEYQKQKDNWDLQPAKTRGPEPVKPNPPPTQKDVPFEAWLKSPRGAQWMATPGVARFAGGFGRTETPAPKEEGE